MKNRTRMHQPCWMPCVGENLSIRILKGAVVSREPIFQRRRDKTVKFWMSNLGGRFTFSVGITLIRVELRNVILSTATFVETWHILAYPPKRQPDTPGAATVSRHRSGGIPARKILDRISWTGKDVRCDDLWLKVAVEELWRY